jgi:hypothetical protein
MFVCHSCWLYTIDERYLNYCINCGGKYKDLSTLKKRNELLYIIIQNLQLKYLFTQYHF